MANLRVKYWDEVNKKIRTYRLGDLDGKSTLSITTYDDLYDEEELYWFCEDVDIDRWKVIGHFEDNDCHKYNIPSSHSLQFEDAENYGVYIMGYNDNLLDIVYLKDVYDIRFGNADEILTTREEREVFELISKIYDNSKKVCKIYFNDSHSIINNGDNLKLRFFKIEED